MQVFDDRFQAESGWNCFHSVFVLLRIEILILGSGGIVWQLLLLFGIIITTHGNMNARTGVVIMR